MTPSSVRAFAPASVSNVCCGFDVFGFAIEGPGDTVTARPTAEDGVHIAAIRGAGGRLPTDPEKNTAGVAARHLLEQAGASHGSTRGVELEVDKDMPLSSGLGSSAASAVAAVVAVNTLFDLGADRETLLRCAIEGERAACGTAHSDNAAPSLFGGFVMVRGAGASSAPVLRVDELPVPPELYCAILRPRVAIDTRAARAALEGEVPLSAAVAQWGNTAAFVAGLFRGDADLLASALEDAVAEPVRTPLVPGFDAVKGAALEAGAIGCGLSGSGPAVFALAFGAEEARGVGAAMAGALNRAMPESPAGDLWISPVAAPGARVLPP
ncbi:MAG: homoserine kinase [Acidobacteriota bacterium]